MKEGNAYESNDTTRSLEDHVEAEDGSMTSEFL